MAEKSKIEWTDHTFNPWQGCTRISAACDHCYAADISARFGRGDLWDGKKRSRTTAAYWRKPIKWEKAAKSFFETEGRRQRVFCASMADVFDNQVPEDWRADLWALIRATPSLDWQLLTKRPQNIGKMLPAFWDEIKSHVWLGATAENQDAADRNIPHLAKHDAAVRFLSVEPMLGPVDLFGHRPIDWVIAGGESGPKARPSSPEWFYDLAIQCDALGIPFLFKQWGAFNEQGRRVGKKRAGRVLSGAVYDQFPLARGF